MKIKFENNWQQKTLENLEKDYWPDIGTEGSSHLITSCTNLRKKPLQDFVVEDLRIMIGQGIGLKYLIPLAIDKLSSDLFAEGDFFPGDLLKSVLHADKKYWVDNPEMWGKINSLLDGLHSEINDNDISVETFNDSRPESSR